jgi:ribosome biogenesis GTPase A
MVVIGSSKSGKSSIINCISIDKDDTDAQDNSIGKV